MRDKIINMLLTTNGVSAFFMAMALDSPNYIPIVVMAVNLAVICVCMKIKERGR